eukprot:TRINITY_DN67031_c6_g7_i1.p2 TRINITY_DN67031_c6_g7~~TRINITY_DN67031_c6_g7_i1.p2  ORF type:complete len:665 (-),score=40.97 TRINITY_DN67031_c6_g7_i1:2260-4254(-)
MRPVRMKRTHRRTAVPISYVLIGLLVVLIVVEYFWLHGTTPSSGRSTVTREHHSTSETMTHKTNTLNTLNTLNTETENSFTHKAREMGTQEHKSTEIEIEHPHTQETNNHTFVPPKSEVQVAKLRAYPQALHTYGVVANSTVTNNTAAKVPKAQKKLISATQKAGSEKDSKDAKPKHKDTLKSLNLTVDGMIAVKGPNKDSCEDICYKRQNACVQKAFEWSSVNNCDLMKHLFNCSKCTVEKPSHLLPHFDIKTGTCRVNDVLSPDSKVVGPDRCKSGPDGIKRLCPCTFLDGIWKKPKRFTGWINDNPNATKPIQARFKSGCDPTNTNFGIPGDRKCVPYLSNISNIQYIQPMAANLLIGRTVKFKVYYKEKFVSAMLKVPQEGFPSDPSTEYMSFQVDRVLSFYRTPPTAWMQFPVAKLLEAIDKADSAYKSEMTRNFYEFTKRNGGIKMVNGEETVGVMIQLWMLDIHRLMDSTWHIPWGKWRTYFDTKTPLPIKGKRREPNIEKSIPSIGDMVLFDYLLGNDDRAPNKNTFVAGGCKYDCSVNERMPRHKGNVTLLFIDNGRAFVSDTRVKWGNALHDSKGTDFCAFRRPTLDKFHKVADRAKKNKDTFAEMVKAKTPEDCWKKVGAPAFTALQKRFEELMDHFAMCVKKLGKAKVYHWP